MEYEEFFITLAGEIIKRACKDYCLALCGAEEYNYRPHMDELRHFFQSAWFGVLTKLDPNKLVEDLEALCAENQYDWKRVLKFFKKIEKKEYKKYEKDSYAA